MNDICITTNIMTTILAFLLSCFTNFLHNYDRDTHVGATGWIIVLCCHSALVFLEFRWVPLALKEGFVDELLQLHSVYSL